MMPSYSAEGLETILLVRTAGLRIAHSYGMATSKVARHALDSAIDAAFVP